MRMNLKTLHFSLINQISVFLRFDVEKVKRQNIVNTFYSILHFLKFILDFSKPNEVIMFVFIMQNSLFAFTKRSC